MEFQGCGVPSAFADPSSYGAAADEDEDGVTAIEDDSLSELPRRTLTIRASGLRVSAH